MAKKSFELAGLAIGFCILALLKILYQFFTQLQSGVVMGNPTISIGVFEHLFV